MAKPYYTIIYRNPSLGSGSMMFTQFWYGWGTESYEEALRELEEAKSEGAVHPDVYDEKAEWHILKVDW